MHPVGILVLELSGNLQSLSRSAVLTAEKSGGVEGCLPATVVSYHVAPALQRVEGVCSCGTFNTHPEVCCSKGGRKGSIILASLVGSGVGSGSVVSLCLDKIAVLLMVQAQSQLIASLVSGCANHSSSEAKPRPRKQTTVQETFLPFCESWYV